MYITTYGPDHGLVTTTLVGALGLEAPPFDIFSPTGIVVVAGVDAVTSVYLLTAPALQNMDASLEEVARIHGANILQTVRSVTFPVILPAILTALIIRFLLGLGEFSVVAILGAREQYEVYATAIWKAVRLRAPPEYGQAAALSISLLLLAAVLVWYHRKVTSRKEDYMTETGQGYQPKTWDLGRWRWPVTGALWLALALVWILPIVALVASYMSIAGERETGSIKLLLGLPNTRTDVVLGKAVGRSLTVIIPLLVAFGLAALINIAMYNEVLLGDFALFTALTLLYGFVFTVIGVGLSSAFASTSKAAAAVGGFWFLNQIWGGIATGLDFLFLDLYFIHI
jgi:ABC-type Fe3+ transport system permease subunit